MDYKYTTQTCFERQQNQLTVAARNKTNFPELEETEVQNKFFIDKNFETSKILSMNHS